MTDETMNLGVISAWNSARQRARESVAWSRLRWFSLAYVILALLFVVGGLYAFGAHRVVGTNLTYKMFENVFPGGLHTHGGIMLVAGGVILSLLLRQQQLSARWWPALRMTFLFVFGYFLWTAVLFLLAPTQPEGRISWIAVSIWTILSALPLILTFGPPPNLITSDEVTLILILRESGVAPDLARGIAERFFRGGFDEGP